MSTILGIERVRAAVTKTAKLLARDKVQVRQQGHVPHVAYGKDGRVMYVNLPTIPEDPPEDFLLAVQGFLDHEVAHVLYTNVLLERPHYERAERDGLNVELCKSFCNAFEDIRIERAMSAEFKGSAYNLSKSLGFVLEKKVQPRVELAKTKSDPREIVNIVLPGAFVAYARAKGGSLEAREFMDAHDLWPIFAIIDKVMPNLQERLDALKDSGDAAALAYDMTKAVTPPPPPPPPPTPPMKTDCSDPDKEPDEDSEPSDEKPEDTEKGEGEPEDGDEEDGDAEEAPEDADDGKSKESDDKEDEGEGAGGGDDETDSETHSPEPEEDNFEEDDTPDESDEDDAPPFGGEDDEPEEEKPFEEDDSADEDAEPADEDTPDDEDEEDAEDEEPGDLEESEDQGEGRDSNLTLTQAMKRLDANQRRALFLYNNKRKTVRATAETMKKTVEETEGLLLSARRRLKELMGK
jgi:DNA-directed RNA polymerase specialized sigma24 family protein